MEYYKFTTHIYKYIYNIEWLPFNNYTEATIYGKEKYGIDPWLHENLETGATMDKYPFKHYGLNPGHNIPPVLKETKIAYYQKCIEKKVLKNNKKPKYKTNTKYQINKFNKYCKEENITFGSLIKLIEFDTIDGTYTEEKEIKCAFVTSFDEDHEMYLEEMFNFKCYKFEINSEKMYLFK